VLLTIPHAKLRFQIPHPDGHLLPWILLHLRRLAQERRTLPFYPPLFSLSLSALIGNGALGSLTLLSTCARACSGKGSCLYLQCVRSTSATGSQYLVRSTPPRWHLSLNLTHL
jgi:hypothetical protein